MTLRWLLAAMHLLPLGVGLGSVWARARLLGGATLDGVTLRRALAADAWWAVAALLWFGQRPLAPVRGHREGHGVLSGEPRLLDQDGPAGRAILALEVRPIVTLTAWRRILARGETPDLRAAGGIARTSYVQAALVILMVLAATAMARGLG